MSDHQLIYLIVLLNTLCQIMLIWRQRDINSTRWLFVGLAAAVPLLLMIVMRILVSGGVIHGHLADQTAPERALTHVTSILLLAGPWLVTLAAVLFNRSIKMRTRHLSHIEAS